MGSARTGYVVAILAVVLGAIALVALIELGGDDGVEPAATDSTPSQPETIATVTLDEVGCTYEGDRTPEAPAFMMDTVNLTSGYGLFEVDGIPADVTNEEVEEFFEDAQVTLSLGGGFRGVPADWRLNRGGGQSTQMGGMLVGDPLFEDQMLVAGQRYVIWCSTAETPTPESPTDNRPTAVFLAAIVEVTE